MAKFGTTERGGRKLIYNGFGYVKKDERGDSIRWFCDKKNSLNCLAYAKTKKDAKDDDDVDERGEHTHERNLAIGEVIRVKNLLKRKADESVAPTSVLVTEVVGGMDVNAASSLPRIDSLKRNVRNYRSGDYYDPKTAMELVLGEKFSKTKDGDDFILLDDVYGSEKDKRIVAFATKKDLERLSASNFWMMDGTFKAAPSIFTQLYTIHALVSGEAIPVVYALLPDKRKETYLILLRAVWNAITNLSGDPIRVAPPDIIISDFEMAAIMAIEEVFNKPGIQFTMVHGCYFHLGQNLLRHVNDCGYKKMYDDNHEFVIKVKMIAALSFVKTHCVLDYYIQLEKLWSSVQSDVNEAVLRVLHYFGRNYVEINEAGVVIKPLFPPPLWNNVQLTEIDGPRTNNNVEGWHNRFKRSLGCSHPIFSKFFEAVQSEQAYMMRYYEMVLAEKGRTERKETGEKNVSFNNAIANFGNVPFDDYLRMIARKIHIPNL